MKIKLTKNKFALVDDQDFEWLNQWKWCVSNNNYAVRIQNKKAILMHRLIMNTPTEFDTDHINNDKLDNRRSNLRIVTRSQNMMNVGIRKNNKSGYKNIVWDRQLKHWRVKIMKDYQNIDQKLFKNLSEAILYRDEIVYKNHNDYARI